MAWFRFNTRARHLDEFIATYVAELCCLAQNCAFGDALDDMLQNRLVCGIRHERKQ